MIRLGGGTALPLVLVILVGCASQPTAPTWTATTHCVRDSIRVDTIRLADGTKDLDTTVFGTCGVELAPP